MLVVRTFSLLLLAAVLGTPVFADIYRDVYAGFGKVAENAESTTRNLARSWEENSMTENATVMATWLSNPKLSEKTIEAVLSAARELTKKDKNNIFARYLKYSAQTVLKERFQEIDVEDAKIDSQYKEAFAAALEEEKPASEKPASEKPAGDKATAQNSTPTTEKPAADDVDDQTTHEGSGGPVPGDATRPTDDSPISKWVSGLGLKEAGANAKVEKWMKELENKETRWGAAEKLLAQDAIWNKDKALLKNLSEFELSGEAQETLKKLYAARNQTDVKVLRAAAHGDPEDKASRLEVTRRVNSTEKENDWMQKGFPSIRPELLLEFKEKIKSDDTTVAGKALAEMIGTLNSDQKSALKDKASGWLEKNKDEGLKTFAARMACASLLALSKGKEVAKACKDLGDFADKFNTAYEQVRNGHKKFHEYLAKADEKGGVEKARAWLFDKTKGNYSEENLMDYLGQRVESCDKLKSGTEEQKNACDDATRLAKVLGWKDDKGNWNLNMSTRDAGTDSNAAQLVQLGGADDIGKNLAAFGRRETGFNPNTKTKTFGKDNNRSRFQSFAYAPTHNAAGGQDSALNKTFTKKKPKLYSVKDGKVAVLGKAPTMAAAAPKTETPTEGEKPAGTDDTKQTPAQKQFKALTAAEIDTKILSAGANKCAQCHHDNDGGRGSLSAEFLNGSFENEDQFNKMVGPQLKLKGVTLTPDEIRSLRILSGFEEAAK